MTNVRLRPVEIIYNGEKKRGFFHRFIYQHDNFHSETLVLVELEDGRLRSVDPYFVKFMDRSKNLDPSKNVDKEPSKD